MIRSNCTCADNAHVPLIGNEQVHFIILTTNDDYANAGTAAAAETSVPSKAGTSGGGLQLSLLPLSQLESLLQFFLECCKLKFLLDLLVRQLYHP
ncbi:unnamed protein product [Caenorhabditis nigoni]